MIWTIDLTDVSIWYFVVTFTIVAVGLLAGWWHRTALPVIWGISSGIIMLFGASQLEPLIFGYQYYALWSLQWWAISIFGLLFAYIQIQSGYNAIVYGSVVE